MHKNDLIGSVEAASILHIDRATFNRRAALGGIPCVVKAPGNTGPRLFDRAVIERIARTKASAA